MLPLLARMVLLLAVVPAGSCGEAPPVVRAEEGPPPAVQTPPSQAGRVLVVINKASQDSIAVGAYYVSKRQIPKGNVVMIECATTDTITVDEYSQKVLPEVKKGLAKAGASIDFIVTTKGVPIRLRDDAGWSLDGHLAAMNLGLRPMAGLNDANADEQISKSLNPYFRSTERFTSKKFGGMYLVTRLDGYTVEDCKRLVDRSLAAKAEKGPFFFNGAAGRDESGYGEMQQSLVRADSLLRSRGFETTYDRKKFVAPEDALAGYASWGSNDGTFDLATYRRLKFKPGALVETYVSTSARTFRPTTGGQSLIADLIAQGVTGVKGYVSEPYSFALAYPDIIFDRYTAGFNLAESFYAASMMASWKDLVIGDPLCSPYAK
ncbi:MAG TPA: TIGR03790 family protein [Fimbriimonadaceae bacterium]|nr:TIGR03790 family protein [Fimbriimonadaceae bacterium]